MALARIMSGEPVCVARRAEKRKSFQGDGRDVPQPGGAPVRPAGVPSGALCRGIRPVDSFSTGSRLHGPSHERPIQTVGFVLAKAWGFVPWLSPVDCNCRDDTLFSGARPPNKWAARSHCSTRATLRHVRLRDVRSEAMVAVRPWTSRTGWARKPENPSK